MNEERYVVTLGLTDREAREFEVDAAEVERLTTPTEVLVAAVVSKLQPRFSVRATDGTFFAVRDDLVETVMIRPKALADRARWT